MQDAVSNEIEAAVPSQPEKVQCAGCGHSKLPFLFSPSQLDRGKPRCRLCCRKTRRR